MSSNNKADDIITDMRHNDYVGSDANIGRIPGADQARTGHHYVEVFPKGKHCALTLTTMRPYESYA